VEDNVIGGKREKTKKTKSRGEAVSINERRFEDDGAGDGVETEHNIDSTTNEQMESMEGIQGDEQVVATHEKPKKSNRNAAEGAEMDQETWVIEEPEIQIDASSQIVYSNAGLRPAKSKKVRRRGDESADRFDAVIDKEAAEDQSTGVNQSPEMPATAVDSEFAIESTPAAEADRPNVSGSSEGRSRRGRYDAESSRKTKVLYPPSGDDEVVHQEPSYEEPEIVERSSEVKRGDELWELFGFRLDTLCGSLLISDTCCDGDSTAPVRAVDELCQRIFGQAEDEGYSLAYRLKAAAPAQLTRVSGSQSPPPPALPLVPPPCDFDELSDGDSSDRKSKSKPQNDEPELDVFGRRKYRSSEPPNLLVTDDELRLLPNVDNAGDVFEVNTATVDQMTVETLPERTLTKPDRVVAAPTAGPLLPPADERAFDSGSDSPLPSPPPLSMLMSPLLTPARDAVDGSAAARPKLTAERADTCDIERTKGAGKSGKRAKATARERAIRARETGK
jgi:hypothetical protein